MSTDHEAPAPVIRIVKKKHVHAGHHGGSWKVAYADFVTAMMAFFMVMWIVSMDQNIKQDVQNYFNDPFSASDSKAGISKLAAGGTNPLASGFAGAMDAHTWTGLAQSAQSAKFEKVQSKLRQEIQSRPDLSRLLKGVEIHVSDSGLRIDLIERDQATFFESGSAIVPADAREVLTVIAGELSKLPNSIIIEGHTDSMPYPGGRGGYSNWELSADRANAARRVLETSGVRQHQVIEVRGYADTHLRDPAHPTDSSNRRVSILVRYGLPGQEKSEDGGGASTRSGVTSTDSPFKVDIRPMALPSGSAQ